MKNITFIGLGNMGSPMAANLIKAGYNVTVFDLVESAMDALCDTGARKAASVSDAVSQAEAVITMLPAAAHVRSLYCGEAGILASLNTSCLLIDCSTIDADTARETGHAAEQAGHRFIDAPVSGGVAGATAGTLTFIAGGKAEVVEQASPLLNVMGQNLFHAGDTGAGQVAKICNNMLLAVLMAGTSEALQLAIDNGLDPKVMSDIMLQSSGCNWTLQKYNPCPGVMESVPSSNAYQGGFMVKLMNKDLGLAMDTGAKTGSSLPMGSAAQQLYRMHQRKGNSELDFSSIFTLFSKDTI